MNITRIALPLLLAVGAGCTTLPPASVLSMSGLPNCFDSNYDKDLNLFTLKNVVGNPVNQQCLLTVGPSGEAAPASQLPAGRYRVSLANGGGGGAGGTLQATAGGRGGGGGGGGAGAEEQQTTVDLSEGQYRLTLGAGGPGGNACSLSAEFGGGPGWAGSPSNMVRVETGELILGAPGAEKYARPTRARNERLASKVPGEGGSGPGQTTGGSGGLETKRGVIVEATAGAARGSEEGGGGGADPIDRSLSGGGGGGGATSRGEGGDGGGETAGRASAPVLGFLGRSAAPSIAQTGATSARIPRPEVVVPERGELGSGGGGGVGSSFACKAGAQGGHGFIALRPI